MESKIEIKGVSDAPNQQRRCILSARFGFHLAIIYISIVFSSTIVFWTGLIPELKHGYSAHLTLRQQTESLLNCRLGLSESVVDITHDHVWDNCRVQHVWGLGVPGWRVPFEFFIRWIPSQAKESGRGYEGMIFPDRVAFGVALGIAFILILFAFSNFQRDVASFRLWVEEIFKHRERCFPLILLLFPPFLTLLHVERFGVYEEVQAYSYLCGIGLLGGTMLFVRSSHFWLFALVMALSGLAAFIRPTAGVFGVVALFVLLLKAINLGWNWWRLGIGIVLFLTGGVLLYFSNWIRFGSGLEFGHNLNLNNIDTMRFAGRFEAPYRSEPILSAARELGSMLFLESGYHSETFRERQIYFSLYNITYLVPLIVVVCWFGNRCWKMLRNRTLSFKETEVLGFWFVGCTIPLILFYLRFPFMNSRYLLDFAPGFAAGLLAFFYLLSAWGVARFGTKFRLLILGGVIIWWVYQMIFVTEYGRNPRINSLTSIPKEEVLERMNRKQPVYRDTPEFYEIGMPFREFVNLYNGSGWNWYSGNTRASIALFVEDPEFLELTVVPVADTELSWDDYGIIRAKVALEFLELERMIPIEEGMVLRFSGPKRKRYQDGIQVLFVAFMTAEELHEGTSRFRLLRVRWNHASLDSG